MALPQYDFSGIVSTADQSGATYLPLKSLNVDIFIADVSARVVLSQVYSHDGYDTLSDAYYVFPVPARAAVCSFEMKTGNGVRLRGVVKEVSQAKQEYQEARNKGWLTGLLEQFRQDGSMPPNTDVTVLLSYVVDLSENDQNETVRFQLSSHVRARYGAPLNSVLYRDTAHSAPLSITVDMEMPGEILQATSLNHNPFVDLPVPPTSPGSAGARRCRHFARKQFSSPLFDLQYDFLLIIRALGLGRPRCFAEHISHEDNLLRSVVGPTTALALTIVPQFDLNLRQVEEYIFVIDRSGSMDGQRMEMAKQALILLLEQLSNPNSVFDIYSFGSKFERWTRSGSKRYAKATVHEATIYINNMQADMGGTELLNPLRDIFQSRRRDIPTCIFVLTDGEIYYIDSAVEAVRQAVSMASVAAPLRVFTLGIGSGASTELCQRLALAGNGSHMMTLDGEPLALKATRLVKAMQTPQVKEMSVVWGDANQARQAPHQIGALSPGMRLLVTAIIPDEQVPAEVTLRLVLSDGTTFNYTVPVQQVSFRVPSGLTEAFGEITDVPPLLHTLAAHLLIQDVEGGNTQPLELQTWATLSPETRRDVVKRYIVELGTQYQVASSFTAFVAVAAPKPSVKLPRHHGHSSDDTSQGASPTRKSMSRDQGSRNGHTNGSISSKRSSKDSPTRQEGGTCGGLQSSNDKKKLNLPDRSPRTDASHEGSGGGGGKLKQDSHSGTDGEPDKEDSTTPLRRVKQKDIPASPKPSRGAKTSSSQASWRGAGSVNGSSLKWGENQSQSPASRMPGAFRHSPDTGTKGSGWMFDFFVHKPSPESVPVGEVLCVPNPQGGSPMVFTAPPLPYYTTITTIAGSWLKSLQSFIFSKNQAGEPRRRFQTTASAFPVAHKALFPDEILTISRLQSSSDGSFSIIPELCLVVGIPELQLRNLPPSMTYGEDNSSIWATAIAVAFCRKRLVEYVALWEDITEKASNFGSGVCGSIDIFEGIVQEALQLFQP